MRHSFQKWWQICKDILGSYFYDRTVQCKHTLFSTKNFVKKSQQVLNSINENVHGGTWLEMDYRQLSNIWGILIVVWQVKGKSIDKCDTPFKGDGIRGLLSYSKIFHFFLFHLSSNDLVRFLVVLICFWGIQK